MQQTAATLNALTERIIGAGIAVHRALGPGLLESVYEACLARELTVRGLAVDRQVPLAIRYRGMQVGCAYRIDLLVERTAIVELKTVARLETIHQAQLLSYLRLSNYPIGLLINFNVQQLRSGIRRVINGHPR